MRVLFSSAPLHGHLLPMMPLARAFAARGHVVGVLTAASGVPAVEPEGFDLLVAGPSTEEVITESVRVTGTDPRLRDGGNSDAYLFGGARVDLAAEASLAATAEWKPDLVVHEIVDCVGPLVAAAQGVPCVVFGMISLPPTGSTEAVAEVVASRFTDRGLRREPALRYVDSCPPSLNYADRLPPAERLLIRPVAHSRPGSAAATPARADRPTALVTFGTVSQCFTNPAELSTLIRALDGVDVVVTLGPEGREADFDVDRDRVRFTPFAPLDELLVGVDVVVTHGGAGTTFAALGHGIPLVVLPKGADHPRQADRVSALGAGLATRPRRPRSRRP